MTSVRTYSSLLCFINFPVFLSGIVYCCVCSHLLGWLRKFRCLTFVSSRCYNNFLLFRLCVSLFACICSQLSKRSIKDLALSNSLCLRKGFKSCSGYQISEKWIWERTAELYIRLYCSLQTILSFINSYTNLNFFLIIVADVAYRKLVHR